MQKVRSDAHEILDILSGSHAVQQLAAAATRSGMASIRTLHGSARPAVVAALWQIADAPMVVITGDDRTSDDHAHDLGMLVGADHVRTIHSSIRHKALSDAGSLRHDEVDALMRLHADDRTLIVISSSALLVKLPAREDLDSVQRSVRRGEDLPFEEFVTSLAINGYERTDYVGKPGEMAVRGGILDIYPGCRLLRPSRRACRHSRYVHSR